MTIEPQWLIMGGAAALVGSLVLVSRAQERKRRAAYEEFCVIRGFTFEPERPDGERRFADVFDPFTAGRRRTWGYTISGTKNQAPFTVFEYRWVTGGGKNSSTHRIGGIVWERDDAAFPKFALSPEGWFSRLGHMFGAQDIDFPESPEFSRAYQLKGPDEPAIRSMSGSSRAIRCAGGCCRHDQAGGAGDARARPAARAQRQRVGARGGAVAEMDARPDRRASRAGTHAQRGDVQGAQESRADEATAAHTRREDREAVHFWISLVSAGPQVTGTHDTRCGDHAGDRRGAFPCRDRGVGSGRPRAAA